LLRQGAVTGGKACVAGAAYSRKSICRCCFCSSSCRQGIVPVQAQSHVRTRDNASSKARDQQLSQLRVCCLLGMLLWCSAHCRWHCGGWRGLCPDHRLTPADTCTDRSPPRIAGFSIAALWLHFVRAAVCWRDNGLADMCLISLLTGVDSLRLFAICLNRHSYGLAPDLARAQLRRPCCSMPVGLRQHRD
jgi:hypothetical protein